MKLRRYILMLFVMLPLMAAAQRFFNLTADEVKVGQSLPYFTYSQPLPADYADSVYTVNIKYPEYIDMMPADTLRYLNIKDQRPEAYPVIEQWVAVEKKQGILEVAFSPIICKDGKWQKLVSFMLDIKSTPKPSNAKGVRSRSDESKSIYAEHSVLSTGRWAKIRVPGSGVYQLTSDVVRQAGFNDVSKVRIYGYGGNLQNEEIVTSELAQLDDLKEVPVYVHKGKRLFYANGTVSWDSKAAMTRTRNPYSDYGYYLITDSQDGDPSTVDSLTFVQSFYPNASDYHSHHEIDNYAWYEGGRNLFENSPVADGKTKDYTITVPDGNGTAMFQVAVTCGADAAYQIMVNDSLCATGSITLGRYDKAARSTDTFIVLGPKASNKVTIKSVSGVLRLDYITATFDQPRECIDLDAVADQPQYVYNITNQDLHADKDYQMVIIIPASGKLRAQAERLAAFHEQHDGMKVRVVPADELYNEFSSGTPDANAYRRYLKMLYDKAGDDPARMPKHLLLFGDCLWDNRLNTFFNSASTPDDYLLCFESENSFSETACYVNDGFFCLLDEGEGISQTTRDKMDITVGRFPVTTDHDAKIMVDKTISYIENKNIGSWQNTVIFLGDDGNENLHMRDADACAKKLESINPSYLVKRVMWDVYQRVTTSTGNRYPEVTSILKRQVNSGALVFNYSGHGGPSQLSHEFVLTASDFGDFSNSRLPLWVTASCDIMPFDASATSLGETAILNPKGGAMAFFGTTRTVYTDRNRAINQRFIEALFTRQNGKVVTLGEAQMIAKNRLISYSEDLTENKLQYSLLGDPALVLHIPTLTAVVDEINGIAADGKEQITLKAGAVANIKGHIERDGVRDDSFRGVVSAIVRDSKELIAGKMNDANETSTPFEFYERTKVLFNGTDSVRNGSFDFSFAVPKDINYSGESGQIVLSAYNANKELANGSTEKFVVGGSQLNDVDTQGPSVYCYLNSPNFVNGATVNRTPYFYAEMTDASGINTTGSSIGHDLELSIDNDKDRVYNLNDNFMFDFGDYKKGSTYFSIPALDEGMHTLTFRAWDVLNNPTTTTLTFKVSGALAPSITDINVTRNPAKESTTFVVNHDFVGSNINVEIQILDMSGRLLHAIDANGVSDSTAYTVDWDLTTSTGARLQTGVYLYRVFVSSDGSNRTSKAKKLIVVR